ncbi:MAG: nucleotidyltransferase domain-containing protein [Methylococcales bacterium]
MRLKTEQITNIIEIVQAITPQPFQIRLFGSRLNDEAKGGDVDLLIEIPHLLGLLQKAQLKNALESRLNLPVDLLIVQTGQKLSPFQQIAFEKSVLL